MPFGSKKTGGAWAPGQNNNRNTAQNKHTAASNGRGVQRAGEEGFAENGGAYFAYSDATEGNLAQAGVPDMANGKKLSRKERKEALAAQRKIDFASARRQMMDDAMAAREPEENEKHVFTARAAAEPEAGSAAKNEEENALSASALLKARQNKGEADVWAQVKQAVKRSGKKQDADAEALALGNTTQPSADEKIVYTKGAAALFAESEKKGDSASVSGAGRKPAPGLFDLGEGMHTGELGESENTTDDLDMIFGDISVDEMDLASATSALFEAVRPKKPKKPEPEETAEVKEAGAEVPQRGKKEKTRRERPMPGKKAETVKAKPAKQKKKKEKTPKWEKKPGPVDRGFAAIGRGLGKFSPARALAELFYSLGFYAEAVLVRIWRVVRDAGLFIGQLLGWMFASFFGAIGRGVRNLWNDIAAPFRRMKSGWAHIREVVREEREKEKGSPTKRALGYFGSGVKNYGHLAVNAVMFVMPLVAAAIMGVIVYAMLSANYGLAVEVDGEVLGYVVDQSVVDDAKTMLRGRLRLAEDQKAEDWQLYPVYTVARTSEFNTKQQIVNEILRHSSTDVIQATGLEVNGELVAVTTEGERLRAYLDGILQSHQDPTRPDAVASFVRQVVCEPGTDDVYFESSVMEFEDIIDILNREVEPPKTLSADGVSTLGEIALETNLVWETLIARNPAFAEQDEDFVPEEGTEILIERAKLYLQVQLTYRTVIEEAVPFGKETVENDKVAKGVTRVTQKGVDGQQQATYDITEVDGEVTSKVAVEGMTVVITEPVTEITEEGTMVGGFYGVGGFTPDNIPPMAGGGYMWPVPGYSYSSRGMAQGHRGQDINAATGTPIYAAQSGTVVFAGWHYSYGYYVQIAHADGNSTLYAHCSSLGVVAGQQVAQGEYIGAVGSTGNSSGPHCHFEVHGPDGGLQNPLGYIAPP